MLRFLGCSGSWDAQRWGVLIFRVPGWGALINNIFLQSKNNLDKYIHYILLSCLIVCLIFHQVVSYTDFGILSWKSFQWVIFQ